MCPSGRIIYGRKLSAEGAEGIQAARCVLISQHGAPQELSRPRTFELALNSPLSLKPPKWFKEIPSRWVRAYSMDSMHHARKGPSQLGTLPLGLSNCVPSPHLWCSDRRKRSLLPATISKRSFPKGRSATSTEYVAVPGLFYSGSFRSHLS